MFPDTCTEYGVQEPRDIDSNKYSTDSARSMTGVSGYAGVIQYTWGIKKHPIIFAIARANGAL